MNGKLLKIILLLSLAANIIGLTAGLILFDRTLFYRNKIAADEDDFLNSGLRITAMETVRDAGFENLGVMLGGSLLRYWFLPADAGVPLYNYSSLEENIEVTHARLQETTASLAPSFVVINGGFCQIHTAAHTGRSTDKSIANNMDYLRRMVAVTRNQGILPVLSSLPPVRPVYLMAGKVFFEKESEFKKIENEAIRKFNALIRDMAAAENLPFLDFHRVLADGDGRLRKEYSLMDGEHLNRDGYQALNAYLVKELATLQIEVH